MRNKTRLSDILLNGFVYLATSLSVLALGLIFFYVFTEGKDLLSLDLIRGNYHSRNYVATLPQSSNDSFNLQPTEQTFAIERFGLILEQSENLAGDSVIRVVYVADDSPFSQLVLQETGNEVVSLKEGMIMMRIAYENHPTSLTSRGAAAMAADLNDPDRVVREVMFAQVGGGIRGSIITTVYLIGLTLMMALPLGVLSAIFFNEFAPRNMITKTMRTFTETLTGVPSIIFGLLGITVFVPLTIRITPASGSNLIAGAMTLAVILLPTIIRTTEEALKVVPADHRFASLALGANKTQTVFKVVLPQAIPGILTATFLGIGRIIGESAALIFVLGAAIKDSINIYQPSTSLAVHIWAMMTDEPANVALSSTIAIIILMIVLVMNLSIKGVVSLMIKKGRA